jgi:hypothetical protein
MDNDEYDVDFYSNDLQKDLTVEAKLISYGEWATGLDYFDILEEPVFRVNSVADYEGVEVGITTEEEARVQEILNNMYWNGIK